MLKRVRHPPCFIREPLFVGFPLRSARALWLRQEKQREQTRCDNRVLLFIQELSPLARWLARLMSPYSMSVEASSPLDVHTGVTARSDLFAGNIPLEQNHRKCIFANFDTIIRGIWSWVKVRKWVLFVTSVERKKSDVGCKDLFWHHGYFRTLS